jgi:hypothetical protein
VLVELHLADHDLEGARRSVSEMEELAGRAHLPWMDALLAWGKRAIARETGDASGAAELYRHAADGWERLGVLYEAGVATARRAEALEAAGRPEGVEALREKARTILEPLGALPELARLRSHEAPPTVIPKSRSPATTSGALDSKRPI